MARRSNRIAACVLVVGASLPLPGGTQATSNDFKTQHPLTCLPKGPGTTLAELDYRVSGLTNPGATDETVLCPILVDSEDFWTGETGEAATVTIGYRPGAVAGRITCTSFVTTPNGSPVATSTVVSPQREPGSGHHSIQLPVAIPAYDAFNISRAVLSVACLITPKITLTRLELQERNQATFDDGF